MIQITGNITLALAMLSAVAAVFTAIAAVRFESSKSLKIARGLIIGYAAMLSVASAALFTALIGNDFSFHYVAEYTERALPLGYKLAAFWAGQEGSLLLWAWLLGAVGVVLVFTQWKRQGNEPAIGIAVFGGVCAFFAALMLIAANPFVASAMVEPDGHGLNPMLQDPGMIAHPPTLFVGYAGFTVPFALMIGALLAGKKNTTWISDIRRWCLFSWLFLSIGILLGAQWAYTQLSWGGYWGWDPVENASLLPWLTATALVHSIMAEQHKGMFKMWNASLVALTFLLCIFGTYITRSGVIESVHAFGQSLVGTFFLAFLVTCVIVSIIVITVRRRVLKSDHALGNLIGREAAFLATNILLVGMTVITIVGTIFPLISRTVGSAEVTVGPSFYNRVVAPMGLLLVALMALGPILVYGHDAAKRLARALILPGSCGLAVVIGLLVTGIHSPWPLLAALIAVVAIVNIVIELAKALLARMRTRNEDPAVALARLLDGNHRRYGGQLVHVGMILIVIGIVGSSIFKVEKALTLQPGESAQIAGRKLTLVSLKELPGANYTALEARLTLSDTTGMLGELRPQRRSYHKAEEQIMSQAAIDSNWRADTYVTLEGVEDGTNAVAIKAFVNPLVSWLWTGGAVLALGGVFCLSGKLLPQSWRETVSDPVDRAARSHPPVRVPA